MELSFRIKTPIDQVFEYLSDMQKFVSVHPVIFQIDHKGSNNYLVHETLKLGIIPFSFTYPATVEKDSKNNIVIIRATVFKLTKIEIKYVLIADGDYTVIKENIQFKFPLPIKAIMESIFRKQHSQLFENIALKSS